ncbi:MAG: peptidase T [Anaerolineales bacterium]|nr:peptidase T [Anaerolineales bacterium]
MPDTLLSRFLRYVQIDTQSDARSDTTPSSPGQWDLLRLLETELRALGAADIHLDAFGYLTASVPATSDKDLPTVAFLAHVDTADFPGANVKPLLHPAWDGQPIRLPDDPAQVLDPALYPDLRTAVGKDVVTASGRTLLGADDKAGVAVVMTLVDYLLAHPEVKHGPLRVCFNPDEEIGRGVEKLDLRALGADVAYTLDGEYPGEVNWETFSGDSAVVTIEGVSTHPGWAKPQGMVNALHLAAKLLAVLEAERAGPEYSAGRQGFIHATNLEGNTARAVLRFILRDFDLDGLAAKGARLTQLCTGLQAAEPRARIQLEIKPTYRNMGEWLKQDMRPVDLALEAMRATGLETKIIPVRGGTDGSRLTERGLPTPNLFDGGHNWHGPLEWVAVQDMELAVQACLALIRLWEERGGDYPRSFSRQ